MPRIFMCLHSTFQVNFLLASNLQHTHTQNEPTVSKNCRSVFLNFLLYMLLKIHNKSFIFVGYSFWFEKLIRIIFHFFLTKYSILMSKFWVNLQNNNRYFLHWNFEVSTTGICALKRGYFDSIRNKLENEFQTK